MNCPAHIQIYKDERRSYATCGALQRGWPRSPSRAERRTTRADARAAHHPGRRAHLLHRRAGAGRGGAVPALRFDLYDLFGLEPRLELSTRPRSESAATRCGPRGGGARRALDSEGLAYELNPGDGAFYGPKIDMHLTDSIGRSWQLGRFSSTTRCRSVSTSPTRRGQCGAPAGDDPPRAARSFERFIGIMIEHYAGVLPFWLARFRRSCCPSRTASTRRGGGRGGAGSGGPARRG